MGILSTLLSTPVFGILVLALTPHHKINQIRSLANLFTSIALFLSCWLLVIYNQNDGAMQFNEQFILNPKLGTTFALGVDGLSLPMVFLATLLTSVALLASFNISTHVKSFHISILLLEFGMLGVFLAQDWSLFYIFWELM